MEAAPLISVVIATRNAEESLPRTLKSLGWQSEKDFEVLLIDALSTDHTVDVARRSGLSLAQVVSEPDNGIADAWNKGIGLATGRWLIFLNAGDILHPQHFARARELLLSGGQDFLYCDVIKFSRDGRVLNLIRGSGPDRRGINRGSVGFGHPGSFTSRRLFKDIGVFDTSIRVAIDTDLILRAFQVGARFGRFESCAYMEEGGLSDVQFARSIREFFNAAERCGFVSRRRKKLLEYVLPPARRLVHFARRTYPMIRASKHWSVACINFISNCIPFFGIRMLWFRLIGFSVGKHASIGVDFRFYVLGNVSLGSRSVVNRDCLFDNRAPIEVGEDVSIARGVTIFTSGHDIHSPFFEMTRAPVKIEDYAVLFSGCTIMPGVTVGRGAVVYPGAVVTSDVAPMSVVGGVPARAVAVRSGEPMYNLQYPFPMAM